MATLEDLVLEGLTIEEYYTQNLLDVESYSKKAGRTFKRFKNGFVGGFAVCPFTWHDDTDPSFGTMKDKKHKGVRLCHCFGCGSTMNVIRFHQVMVNAGYVKTKIAITDTIQGNITYEQAKMDLANRLGISDADVEESKVDMNNLYVQKVIEMRKAMNDYTIRDLQNDLLKIRMSDYSLQNKKILVNRALVKRIMQINS